MISAASQLAGKSLPGDWTVLGPIAKAYQATGGNFSHSYRVKHKSGKLAFLKALDFSRALSSADPARALQELTEAFNFERDLLTICKEKNLTKVVKVIDDGSIRMTTPSGSETIQYLIFEEADGDVRKYLGISQAVELAWIYKCLHHVATGLRQLHTVGAAHQDLKPSNVLVFGSDVSKIADMGCASIRTGTGPRDSLKIAGDPGYAPPEILYNYISADWSVRRLGCDLFHLGSFAMFLLAGVNMTAAVQMELPEGYRFSNWGGDFNQVLPYLRDATDRVIVETCRNLPILVSKDTERQLRHLCEPDPRLRGHPKERLGLGSNYSLERFVSAFHLLAKRVEYSIKTS